MTSTQQNNTSDISTDVDKNSVHFANFTNDVRPHRLQEWESIYYQASIPVGLSDVHSVLEFGPGRGLLGIILKHYGLNYASSDVTDMGAKPDFPYSISEFPSGPTFDLVCAFQTLEHNPVETLAAHLRKMASLSNKYVFVSLPFSGRWISLNANICLPGIKKDIRFTLPWHRMFPRRRPVEVYKSSKTPYSHHWFEIGDNKIKKNDFEIMALSINLKAIKSFHVNAYPYHYFVLFEKLI